MSTPQVVHIVGSGLAGSEAAYFLAEQGVNVILHEMRPGKKTEAHQTGLSAELVCSNSLKSKAPTSAPGILKAEMEEMNSLILKCAGSAAIPGGDALTVDRQIFAESVTAALKSHPKIQFSHEEVTHPFENAVTLFATGPLTTASLASWIMKASGEEDLYFYDAIAPILEASSIDSEKSFLANRYGKGGEDAYINCPMNKEEYEAFVDALLSGDRVPPKPFEKEKFFQGCQPIEAIADGGRESLRFGPMKPVGLTDPKTGRYPYAAVQLRPENRACTAYNMVGFQTKLKYGEQKRIFQMIPALKNAEFIRLGSIHRNTYLCSPKVLRGDLSLKKHPQVYFAGQITGVEGYLESAACGLAAAFFISLRLKSLPHDRPPANTALGSLLNFLSLTEPKRFQPGNINFSLMDPAFYEGLGGLGREESRAEMAKQSLQNFRQWWAKYRKIKL